MTSPAITYQFTPEQFALLESEWLAGRNLDVALLIMTFLGCSQKHAYEVKKALLQELSDRRNPIAFGAVSPNMDDDTVKFSWSFLDSNSSKVDDSPRFFDTAKEAFADLGSAMGRYQLTTEYLLIMESKRRYYNSI